jgi:hypothetical protein
MSPSGPTALSCVTSAGVSPAGLLAWVSSIEIAEPGSCVVGGEVAGPGAEPGATAAIALSMLAAFAPELPEVGASPAALLRATPSPMFTREWPLAQAVRFMHNSKASRVFLALVMRVSPADCARIASRARCRSSSLRESRDPSDDSSGSRICGSARLALGPAALRDARQVHAFRMASLELAQECAARSGIQCTTCDAECGEPLFDQLAVGHAAVERGEDRERCLRLVGPERLLRATQRANLGAELFAGLRARDTLRVGWARVYGRYCCGRDDGRIFRGRLRRDRLRGRSRGDRLRGRRARFERARCCRDRRCRDLSPRSIGVAHPVAEYDQQRTDARRRQQRQTASCRPPRLGLGIRWREQREPHGSQHTRRVLFGW